jgi:hypothetical protein
MKERLKIAMNGKNYMFSEKFDDINEAGVFAELMREKYYQ